MMELEATEEDTGIEEFKVTLETIKLLLRFLHSYEIRKGTKPSPLYFTKRRTPVMLPMSNNDATPSRFEKQPMSLFDIKQHWQFKGSKRFVLPKDDREIETHIENIQFNMWYWMYKWKHATEAHTHTYELYKQSVDLYAVDAM